MHEVSNIFTKEKTISSLEVAEMMGISHKELLRKLNGSTDRKGNLVYGKVCEAFSRNGRTVKTKSSTDLPRSAERISQYIGL